jgi:repressor LexA
MFVYHLISTNERLLERMVLMVRTSKGLTNRHQKILKYLDERLSKGYPPSIREIGEATEISSTSVVTYYLKQLEQWGYIEREAKFSRALRLSGVKTPSLIKVPILGPIAAGAPIQIPAAGETYIGDEIDGVDVARSLLPSGEKGVDLFALKVQGESMIDAMVNDGDIVIMKRTEHANNGDMVAIWLPARDETTLKYFYKEKDNYRLQPANPTMKPIIISKDEPLEIKGKVVMVIRSMESLAV